MDVEGRDLLKNGNSLLEDPGLWLAVPASTWTPNGPRGTFAKAGAVEGRMVRARKFWLAAVQTSARHSPLTEPTHRP